MTSKSPSKENKDALTGSIHSTLEKLGEGNLASIIKTDDKASKGIPQDKGASANFTIGEGKIAVALEVMKTFAEQHITYKQETSPRSLRTDETDEALAKMDCSEFVSRYLKELALFEKVPDFTTADMTTENFKVKHKDKLEFMQGSEVEGRKNSFIPQPGDIFLWRRPPSLKRPNGDGHTGIVLSYDAQKDEVTILEALAWSGTDDDKDCKNCTRVSTYSRHGSSLTSHEGWKGYFRPILGKGQ